MSELKLLRKLKHLILCLGYVIVLNSTLLYLIILISAFDVFRCMVGDEQCKWRASCAVDSQVFISIFTSVANVSPRCSCQIHICSPSIVNSKINYFIENKIKHFLAYSVCVTCCLNFIA